jgi:hypothetical protein
MATEQTPRLQETNLREEHEATPESTRSSGAEEERKKIRRFVRFTRLGGGLIKGLNPKQKAEGSGAERWHTMYSALRAGLDTMD